MMHYHISASGVNKNYLQIIYTIRNITEETIEVQCPAWRPGRYEIQNFAKNIKDFKVTTLAGKPLQHRKITKDRWLIDTENNSGIQIAYSYYADLKNAGSSYVDEQLMYLNFVNCCLYTEGRLHEECIIDLELPENFTIACGMPQTGNNRLSATDYYQLADSPLMASPRLQHREYHIGETLFHIWIEGNMVPDWERIIQDFSLFSATQVKTMGEFPEKDYHFLCMVLPTPYYHGVEHRNSTMLVLGPDTQDEEIYHDLLGVSSHELFHAWNIIRIRPVEMLPYDFTKENYFPTCFVAEGCTTYYGDLFLRRSGVMDDAGYFKELEVYMIRHFGSSAYASLSLTESSFDLWLDGYEKGAPQRKVSVYQKGALAALILDLFIRRKYDHTRSLDDVMRLLWQRFGQPFIGYSLDDYKHIAEEVAGEKLDWYWDECIEGNAPLDNRLNEALVFVGLSMEATANYETIRLIVKDDENKAAERKKWLG